MMKCFVFRLHKDLSQNVNMRPEQIVILSVLSLFFCLLPQFSMTSPKCFDNFVSVGLPRRQEMILRYAE